MVFKYLCILVLWRRVAIERINVSFVHPCSQHLLNCAPLFGHPIPTLVLYNMHTDLVINNDFIKYLKERC